jgi:geranylgeranyl pyrophosphate synthase
MVGGQVDDLQGAAGEHVSTAEEGPGIAAEGYLDGDARAARAQTVPDVQLALLERIHRRKTGAMFRAAIRMGGIVARADAENLAALDRYAEKLGLAFQVIDDLLDVRGDPQTLGKSVGKDARQSKLTFPALLGAEESERRAARLIREAQTALQRFGASAECLSSLACYVLERSR